MHLKSLARGIVFFALVIVSVRIFGNLVWDAWGMLIDCLIEKFGMPPWIEYALGIILFLICVQMGIVTLKGAGK